MSWKEIVVGGEEPMRKTVEKMRGDLGTLRTGRASVTLIEGLKVESYGTLMPINQVANLNLSDPRTIEIRPWDISQIPHIEKAVQKSELGLTPVNDGKVVRLSVPALTEERRKELIKVVHKIAEEFRVAVRNERRQIVEQLKKSEKEKKITEDDRKKGEAELQKMTDSYVHKIDETVASKEKEILEV
jgi:ribosome recycling factor